jgi:small basic protein
MRALLKAAALAAVVFLAAMPVLAPVAAFAQDASSAVSSVAPPADTTVSVPVGSWLQASVTVLADILGLVIGGLVTVILAKLPASIRTYVTAGVIAQVDQLLGRAVQFALQKAVDTFGTKEITFDVKSAVVADAVNYAIDHGPGKLIDLMGGAEGIEQKIIARLPLPKDVPAVPAAAPTTTAAAAA